MSKWHKINLISLCHYARLFFCGGRGRGVGSLKTIMHENTSCKKIHAELWVCCMSKWHKILKFLNNNLYHYSIIPTLEGWTIYSFLFWGWVRKVYDCVQGPPLTNFNDWGGGGGSNRGSYFIPKKSTSEFAYPKKLLCFLAYPKNPLSLVHTSEISTSTNTRHICMCIKLMAWFVDD